MRLQGEGVGEIFLGPMGTKYVNLALLPLVSIIIGAATKNNFSQASSVGETLTGWTLEKKIA